MGFRVRGVRLWLGYADAGEDPDVGPLREITSLCGLTFGGEDATEDGTGSSAGVREERQHRQGVVLATCDGQRVRGYRDAVGVISGAEDFNDQREAGR